ncbi:NFACT family protein [Helicobacter burdigaliensis]|uniref:NFACT family protein n=1 Tax=Helicobacter burdigaliensis TaxID=2315334 RepID=UPI000EF6A329|nr:NFACT family protein [Helicobacter burdigaliensis]
MNLAHLKKFAEFLNKNLPLKLRSIRRVGDNLFKLEMEKFLFYLDLNRAKSTIFTTKENLSSPKQYNAPFDNSLQKYCFNAKLIEASVDGDNRILRLRLQGANAYKKIEVILQAEFTGKNTNLILLNPQKIVLDALRHIAPYQSFREVKIGKILLELPQPKNAPKIIEEGRGILEILEENFKELQNQNLEQKISQVLQKISKKMQTLEEILQGLEDKEELEKNAKIQLEYGKKILENIYKFEDFRGESIRLDGMLIQLPKKAKNLSNAAQIFFENSKKLSKKAQNIYIQKENLQDKIYFFTQLSQMVQKVKNLGDLQILASNLQKDKENYKKEETKAYESFFIEGFKVSIGKNQKENILLLKEARAEDIWGHIRDVPSSHLIIHSGKSKIPAIILQKATKILVDFVKSGSGVYEVDYTKRKFVKITQGAKVVYANYQTLRVLKE